MKKIFIVLFFAFIFFIIIDTMTEQMNQVWTVENTTRNCYENEKNMLKDWFKNPKSVKFESCKVWENSSISAEVYAENSYGWTVRNFISCYEWKCKIY